MDEGRQTKDEGRWATVAGIAGAMVIAVIVATVVLLVLSGLNPVVDRLAEPVARSSEDLVWLRKEVVTVTATGSAGAATGSASTDRDLYGRVYAVYVDFTAGISATTDITLSQASPALTMLVVTNTVTDTWYYPAVQQHTSAGAGTSTYETVTVGDALDISVGETTSGTVGVVTIYWGQ